jgi:hypothetical protein
MPDAGLAEVNIGTNMAQNDLQNRKTILKMMLY